MKHAQRTFRVVPPGKYSVPIARLIAPVRAAPVKVVEPGRFSPGRGVAPHAHSPRVLIDPDEYAPQPGGCCGGKPSRRASLNPLDDAAARIERGWPGPTADPQSPARRQHIDFVPAVFRPDGRLPWRYGHGIEPRLPPTRAGFRGFDSPGRGAGDFPFGMGGHEPEPTECESAFRYLGPLQAALVSECLFQAHFQCLNHNGIDGAGCEHSAEFTAALYNGQWGAFFWDCLVRRQPVLARTLFADPNAIFGLGVATGGTIRWHEERYCPGQDCPNVDDCNQLDMWLLGADMDRWTIEFLQTVALRHCVVPRS